MKLQFFKYALVLGLITAVGPFAIDMYLPALPLLKDNLHADTGQVQLSLMVFFIALAICQLVYGPLSDRYGRRPPLFAGLIVFVLASLGCALAPDIHTLIAFRFLQGVGACAGMVITIAIVRDMHSGADAVRLLSLLMLVFSISPILAPLAGSFIIVWSGWRAIFWVVIAAAALGLTLLALFVPETRSRDARAAHGAGMLAGYRELASDPKFIGLALIAAFGTASFFAYLGNSSFVLIEHYGLTPTQYSLCFSVNAIAFFGAAQGNGKLAERFGMRRVVRVATIGYAAAMVALAALTLTGVDTLWVLIGLLFVGYGFLGFVIPNATVLALEDHGAIAGTASALIGTAQFVIGALVMGATGALNDATATTMILAIAGCALATCLLAQLLLLRPHAASTALP